MSSFHNIFSPLKLGNKTLQNRIIMSPVSTGWENEGTFSKQTIEFYKERAKNNGIGLFIIKDGIIGLTGKKNLSDRKISSRYLRNASVLTKTIHEEGSQIILQLQHYGAEAKHPLSISASKIKNRDSQRISGRIPAFMIDKIIKSYAKTAQDAINIANFDGIEINGGGLSLPNTFICPVLNKRSDQWGIQGRHNFAIETVKRIRAYIGPSPLLIYRLSLMDLNPCGTTWNNLIALAKALQFEGVNAFSFDIGLSNNLIPTKGDLTPDGVWDNFFQKFSKEISSPIIFGVNQKDPEKIEKLLSENKNSFVEIGNPLISDPQWSEKIRNNKINDIIPYVEKNLELLAKKDINKNIIYKLAEPIKIRSNKLSDKKVLIIGGGPAGIAAARTAAQMGCMVTLAEERAELGGLFRIGSKIPGRENISKLIDIWEQVLLHQNVEILKNTLVTSSLIEEKFSEYEIVLATGRETAIPDIPGIDSPNVLTVEDLLEHQIPVGHRVAVIGGTTMTTDIVRYLCAPVINENSDWLCSWGIGDPEKHQGGVLGVIPHLTTPERHTNLINLDKRESFEAKLLAEDRFYDLQWLRMHGVNTFEQSKIEQIDTHSIKIRPEADVHGSISLRTDHVVIANGFDPRNELSDELRELGKHYALAGSVTRSEAVYSASEGISDGIEVMQNLLNRVS